MSSYKIVTVKNNIKNSKSQINCIDYSPGYPPPPPKDLGPVDLRWGTPALLIDTHLWKQYLPVVLRTQAVTRLTAQN